MAGAKLIDVTAEGRPHIDRYELVAEIASGGMATVFLARLSGVGGFQRFVAIKRLHPHLANENEFVQMFLDEARLAAGIHHPNVVPILEVGASDRGYYIVMEYVEGNTLAHLLARAATAGVAMPASIALRVVIDMLAGLHGAHELKDSQGNSAELVHRDVSPQNVLVGMDGISRITDFGVARAASRLSGTGAGELKGKISYMAPEQTSGLPLDRRADVFASGIVLWEVLSGRRLFKAPNDAATITRILKEPIPSPRQYNPVVSDEVAAVCLRALERDPNRRFGSAAQFGDALERAAAASPRLHVATPRETAAYVSGVIGKDMEQQREAVRVWLARSDSGPSSTVSSAAMSLPGAQFGAPARDTNAGTRRGVVIAAMALGAVVAVAVVYVLRQPHGSVAGEASAVPAGGSAASAVPSGAAADGGASPAASSGPPAPSAADGAAQKAEAAQPPAQDLAGGQPNPDSREPLPGYRPVPVQPMPRRGPVRGGRGIDLSNPYR